MSRRDDLDPDLAELLHDAVARVEPTERLGELRARTSAPARRPFLAVGAAVLASAAAVAAVAVVGPRLLPADDTDPVERPTASAPESQEPTAGTPSAPVARRAVAAYYLGDTPDGVRLYREFASTDAPDDGPSTSLELLTTAPADPDYRTAWPPGAFAGGEVGDEQITVELAQEDLRDRPQTVTEEEAEASVQQVVYTLQAYAQQPLPVVFTIDDEPAEEVLGTSTATPLAAANQLEVLSLASLTEPAEGATASDTLRVEGRANSFEANVLWSLRDDSDQVVDEGFFMAEGYMAERLFPFAGEIDVSSLKPGSYSLVVETEDPSGGAEGPGASSDSRTVVVE